LPVYGIILSARFRIHRLALPTRAAILFFITNRYLLHITLGVLTAVVVVTNFQSRQAHAQDIGQQSILFALATDQRAEIVEEPVSTETPTKNANYLGSATVSGVPHVDFDYDETADPVQPSIVVPGTIAVQPYATPTDTTRAPRTKTETYIVKDNDTIGSIANRFGVNVGSILWNNNLTERQYIRPGDTLVIPPVSGLIVKVKKGDTLSKLATRYGADAAEISSVNSLMPDATLAVGTDIVIPGGQPPEIVQTQSQIALRSQESLRSTRKPSSALQPEEVLTEPTEPTGPETSSGSVNIPKPADAATQRVATGKLLWPTPGHVITQYYGWRHTGIDIDGDFTSPLYAAADGVVEKAGWNSGGYGLMVLLDHPNGMKTRYGHASKLFVKAGDTVKRGQVIAMMGTTGRSTGTHLHFEVYIGSKRTNPLGYIR